MAGERTIDKIGVKVIPDLSGFRADVVKKLRAMPGIEIGIDAYLEDVTDVKRQLDVLSRDRTVKIAVDADRNGLARFSDGVEREMRESRKTVDNSLREIERALEDVMRRKDINFPVGAEIDNEAWTRFRRDISRLVERYGEEHLITPGVELDDSHKHVLEEELDHLIREYDGKEISLDVNADSFWASRQLSWVSRSRFVDLYVRVNEHSLAAAATAIAALSGGRLLSDVGQDVWDFFKDLDRSIPSITMWTTGIINLTGAMVGFLTQIASFSADLGRISPMLLTLPGLFMGGAVALLATVNAWMDVKDQLGELEEPIKNLRELMSGSYWDEAREPILDMVTNLMPQLEVVMSNASAAMGGFTGAFATALETSLGGGNLEQIFESMAEGFRIMEAGAQGYADMIVHLALIAGEYWPRLADWMTRQATSFAGWMDAIATDGRLDFWMERAIDNLYELGYGLADMGRLLAGVTEAAERAGATGLAGFHDVMERWQLVINSDNGQRALTDYFEGGRIAAEGLGDAIEAIFVGLSNVSDGVRDTFGQSGGTIAEIGRLFGDVLGQVDLWRGLETMLARMESGVTTLRGASEEIASFIGAGAEVVGHFADELAGPLTAALEVILPRLTSLQGPFETLITALTTALESLIRSPQFEELLDNLVRLVEILVDLAVDAIPVVLPMLESLVSLAAAVPPELLAFGIIAGGISTGLFKIVKAVGPLVGELMSLNGAAKGAAGGMGSFGGAVKGIGWAAAVAVAVTALNALGDAMENSIADVAEWENALATGGDAAALFMDGFKMGPVGAQNLLGVSDVDQLKNALDKIDLVKLGDALDPFGTSDYRQVMLAMDNFGEAMANIAREDFSQSVTQFRNLRDEMQLSNEQAGELVWNADAYRDVLYQQATALGINMTGLDDAEQRQVLLAIATRDTTVATGDAAEALEAAGVALYGYTRYGSDLETVLESVAEKQRRLTAEFWESESALRSVGQNLRDFESDMERVLALAAESGEGIVADGWFDYSTQSGADASLAFQNFITGQNDALQFLIDMGVGLDELNTHVQASEDQIRAWADQIGLSPESVQILLDQLLDLPDVVRSVEPELSRLGNELGNELGHSVGASMGDAFESERPFSRLVEGGAGGGVGELATLPSRFAELGLEAALRFREGIESFDGAAVGDLLGSSVANGITGALPQVESSAHGLTRSVDSSMQVMAGHGFTRAVEMGAELERGLGQAQAASVAAVARMVAMMLGAMAVMNTAGFSVGASLGQGIARGIQSTIALVAASAAALVNSATAAAKRAGDIHSPSRLWDREIGYQLGAGGARGIARSAVLMANAARDAMPVPVLETAGAGGGAGAGAPTIGQVTLVSKNDDPGEDIREVWHYTKVIAGGGEV